MIDEARILLEEERYDDALAVLRDHLGDDAPSEALRLAGLAHMGLGNPADALAALQRAAACGVGTQRFTCLSAAAAAAQALRDFPTAEVLLRQALEIRPDSVSAGTTLARLLIARRAYQDAEATAQAVLDHAPGNTQARVALAVALFCQRRFQQAQQVVHEAAVAGDALALLVSARAAMAAGNSSHAMRRLIAAYRLSPPDYRLALGVADLARTCGRPLIAEEALRRAVSLRPEAIHPRRRLVTLLLNRERAHEAIVILQQILQLAPDDVDANVQLGLALLRAGRLEQTIEHFFALSDRAIALPEPAIIALTKALTDAGRLDEAEAVLRSCLDDNPDWPEVRLTLGVLLAGRARYAEALPYLEASAADRPTEASAWYYLAQAQFCLGDQDAARASAEQVLALRPGHGQANRLLRRLNSSLTTAEGPSLPPSVVAALAFQRAKAFQFTGDPLMTGPRHSLHRTLHDRWVSINALLFRAIHLRYVGNMFAYVAELWSPISTMLLFLVLFTVVRHRTGAGDFSVPMFILTGFGVMSLFTGASKAVSGSIGRSAVLLSYPKIRPVDLQISQLLRNTALTLTAVGIFTIGMILFDAFLPPHDIGRVIVCLFLMLYIGTGWGLLVEAIRAVFPGFRFFNAVINRVLLLSSGVFLPYEHLPTPVQKIVWWNPLLHVVELLRQAFSAMFIARGLTLWYPVAAGSALLALGIIVNLRLRNRMLEGKPQEDSGNDDPFD